MIFYRRLKPVTAISFDLDDTLYSNAPVMMATERFMVNYFEKNLPRNTTPYDYRYWSSFRRQAIADNPKLAHDVGALRLQTYFLGINVLVNAEQQARVLANAAMNEFNHHRSHFDVPQVSHRLLNSLAKHFPLIAISNGNVDTQKIGLAHYFQHIYHADLTQQQKPSTDMFVKACNALAIAPHQLLHVGDCGHSDIYGAIKAGCQTAWVSTYNVGQPLSVLPSIALTQVEQLQRLIPSDKVDNI